MGRSQLVIPPTSDAHVHLVIGGSMRETALADLQAGFTTVVDLGARTTRVLAFRDSINAGLVPGPRVLAAGIWIGRRNGVCEFGGIGIAGGAEGFRQRVRENVEAGADVIKACVSGWAPAAYAEPDTYELPESVLVSIVAEARRFDRCRQGLGDGRLPGHDRARAHRGHHRRRRRPAHGSHGPEQGPLCDAAGPGGRAAAVTV
jgi:imidazolonepropionase-like amidohydrolase